MDALIHSIQACLGLGREINQGFLHKKDDDISLDSANRWVTIYPIDKSVRNFETQAIQEYVTTIFQELKKIDINSTNVHIIANHLHEMAEQCGRIQTFCLVEIEKLQCHPQDKETLQRRLVYLMSDYP